MDLRSVLADIANAVTAVDSSGVAFKQFLPGVGPYGEPQLVRLIADYLVSLSSYSGLVQTKRVPDLLIRGHWAIEHLATTISWQRIGQSICYIPIQVMSVHLAIA
jgi:hypothetical protein